MAKKYKLMPLMADKQINARDGQKVQMNARNGQNYQLMPEMAKKYKSMPEMAYNTY